MDFYDPALDGLGPEVAGRLRVFAATVGEVVEPAVAALEAHRDLPSTDGEHVRFAPSTRPRAEPSGTRGSSRLRRPSRPGCSTCSRTPARAGTRAPSSARPGLVRALRREASPELRERFLPPLLERDYARAQRGAQFLTERHGGSDVGANRVEAVPDGDAWRLSGEKWFCSVADADQFVVTARPRGAPAGTRGIGCFLVPRAAGGFRIRRLKDKLGTRALATGEIEFDGALGYSLGPVGTAFDASSTPRGG